MQTRESRLQVLKVGDLCILDSQNRKQYGDAMNFVIVPVGPNFNVNLFNQVSNPEPLSLLRFYDNQLS